MQKPTLRSIAEACGVSVSAVALAFNQPQKLSKLVREKILAEALKQGYYFQKRISARKILLVFDKFRNFYMGEYYHDIVFGLLERLTELNLPLRILNNFEVSYGNIYDYSGIIFVGQTPDTWIEKAKKYNIPFVLCGHPSNDQTITSIVPDFESGFSLILDYIINCGHKNIGLILGQTIQEDPLTQIILKTYKSTLSKAALSYQEKYVSFADYSNMQSVKIAFHKLLSQKPAPSAIQCSNDVFAYLCLKEAQKNKIKIPAELSISGFDGTNLPWFIDNPQYFLTTVWTDTTLLGKESIDKLLSLIEDPKLKRSTYKIPTQLMIRDSIRRKN